MKTHITYSMILLAFTSASSLPSLVSAFEIDHGQAAPSAHTSSSSFKRGLALSWIGDQMTTTIGEISTSNVYVNDHAGLQGKSLREQDAPNVVLEYKHNQLIQITIYPK